MSSSHTSVQLDISEWPGIGYLIVLAVALHVLSIELNDFLWQYIVRSFQGEERAPYLIAIRWLLVPSFAVSAYLVARAGGQGAYLAAFGFIVTLLLIFNFRSANVRPGTFDDWRYSSWLWMGYPLSGFVIGLVVGLWQSTTKFRLRTVKLPQFALLLSLSVGVFGLVALREENLSRSVSAFPASRHIALYVLALCLFVVACAAELERRKGV